MPTSETASLQPRIETRDREREPSWRPLLSLGYFCDEAERKLDDFSPDFSPDSEFQVSRHGCRALPLRGDDDADGRLPGPK